MNHLKYSPAKAAALREHLLKAQVEPVVLDHFQRHPHLRSAALLVAQYWNDEADDAVHHRLLFSELETPDTDAAFRDQENDGVNFATPPGEERWEAEAQRYVFSWPDNREAIPLFAAFTREDCHQDMTPLESFTPYAIFRRTGTGLAIEVVGQMLRPWLDGVRPSWEQDV
ncbi:hypothetical protein KRR26_00465 [Corallococcus sp. M34]|uniref:hypothetical protein n=1 Tax=Citreicoccus inhibens TaxID=2849499 RepID=UPI001C22FCCC|nr:hypothetical protein [Citreicoccus inhibens]MBU8894050.1 hypothetical protein [Citreicoccus inhibens]